MGSKFSTCMSKIGLDFFTQVASTINMFDRDHAPSKKDHQVSPDGYRIKLTYVSIKLNTKFACYVWHVLQRSLSQLHNVL